MNEQRTWIEKTHKIQKKDRIKLLEYAGEVMYPEAEKRWVSTSWADGGLRLWYSDPNSVLGREYNDDLRFSWKWSKTKQTGHLRLWIANRVFIMQIRRETGCNIQEHEMWEE